MRSKVNKMVSRIKYRLETRFKSPLDSNLDLNNFCQFCQTVDQIDLETYHRSGIVMVKNVFSQNLIDGWRKKIESEIGIEKFKGEINKSVYWLASIADTSVGSQIVANKNVVAALERLIGTDRVFIGHDSVSIDYSVPGLHDDQKSFRQLYGNDSFSDVNTVRVLFNLNSEFSFPQRFGFVWGSHHRGKHDINHPWCERNIKWVEVSHGAAIFFDPRIVHSADLHTHTKTMVVLTYDKDDLKIEELFRHTNEQRAQGASANSSIWKKIDQIGLTPKFLKSQ